MQSNTPKPYLPKPVRRSYRSTVFDREMSLLLHGNDNQAESTFSNLLLPCVTTPEFVDQD
jgi:hypothetical protein